MIHRLRKVTDQLFRGSAPSPKEVLWLKDQLGIKKIVSLDKQAGERINRACQLLDISHIVVGIDIRHLKIDLLKFLKNDLEELFLQGGPTYVHCKAGKDRTGLAIALVQCKYLNKDPEKAIEGAKSLGFGIGIPPQVTQIFEKLIRSCKPSGDTNHLSVNEKQDIVSTERQNGGDNRDSFLDEGHQGSFVPYLNVTRQNPMDALYPFTLDQSPTRENYHPGQSINEHNHDHSEDPGNTVPLVGVYDNDAGGRGFGPVEPNPGGFIYD